MRYRLDTQIVLSGVPEGPFAEHLRAYATSLRLQGYEAHYLHRHVISQRASVNGSSAGD
jgi:hypothetical protein